MFNEYPYRNLTDVNLDYILKHIRDLATNLQDFIKLNTIKYADPIDWNISKQYEANTVVIDGNTGTAYLSVQPVPAGVALTNDDYWNVIFTLNLTTSNQNITFRDDGTNVVATFASDTGDWILWNFYLYKVTQPIAINTAYVEGFNIERYSVELFIEGYIDDLISTFNNIIGHLDDLNTSDKTSVVNAINSVLSDLNTKIGDLDNLTTSDKTSVVNAINSVLSDLNTKIGDLVNLTTSDKTSVVNAINETLTEAKDKIFVTPEMFGAVGDGLTNDTAAIQAALDSGKNVLMNGNYLIVAPSESIHNTLIVPSNIIIDGKGKIILADNDYANYSIFYIHEKNNVTIKNIEIVGDSNTHLGITGEWGFGIVVSDSTNILIDNVKVSNCWGDGIYVGHYHATDTQNQRSENINIVNSFITHSGRNNISVVDGNKIRISKCNITGAYRTSPMAGIDIEPNEGNAVYDCIISDCFISDNTNKEIQIVHRNDQDVTKVIITGNIIKGSRGINGECLVASPVINDLISNNVFFVADEIVYGPIYTCDFINNEVYMTHQSTAVPFNLGKVNAVIKDNVFENINCTDYVFKLIGQFVTFEGNLFKSVSCANYIIDISSNSKIANNTIDILTSTISHIININAYQHLHIVNNVITGRSHAPNYFVVSATASTNDEVIAFNDVVVGAGISNRTMNTHANMINRAYTA